MNIIDWKIIQTRNDITYIKKIINKNNVANWSLFFDVFLILLAFSFDRIFHDNNEIISRVWIIIAIIGVAIPLTLFLLVYKSNKKREMINKKVNNVRSLVSLFDDEICYLIMTAESFGDQISKMGAIKTHKDALLLQFYLIEEEYYLNKAVSLLFKTDSNLKSLLSDDEIGNDKISKKRFINAISLIASLYEEMILYIDSLPANIYSVVFKSEEMKKTYNYLKQFVDDRKETIGLDTNAVFKM